MDMASLWLPILLSGVFVFIASALFHMIIPIHKGDFKKVPGEAGVMAELRKNGIGRGVYMFPACDSMKDMQKPEFLERYKQGPVGIMTILPGGNAPSMGKNLIQWFIFCLLISTVVACILTLLPAGSTYGVVFKWAAHVAILGYCAGTLSESIWGGRPWGHTAKYLFDGIVYGLVTAGTFGWLFPKGM